MGKLSFWSDEIPVIGERRQVINEDMVFGRTLYPATCVSIGNPHCVIPMQEISEPLVCKIGRESERARYFPNHINTELMKEEPDTPWQTEPEHVRQQVLRTNWD